MIRLDSVSVTFNRDTVGERQALKNFSLEISAGEWCSVIGPNGSGKSTLLKIVSGELPPTSGRVFFDRRDVTDLSQRERAAFLQFVEQDTMANVVPSMTIAENIVLGIKLPGANAWSTGLGPIQRAAIEEHLWAFGLGLEKRLSCQVRLLSGGERQAIALARALLREDCHLLLLDEFLGAIDARTAPRLLDIVRRLAAERRMTVIAVTHNLDHVASQPEGRLVVLCEGRLHSGTQLPRAMTIAEVTSMFTDALRVASSSAGVPE